jgi:hypothetical protein
MGAGTPFRWQGPAILLLLTSCIVLLLSTSGRPSLFLGSAVHETTYNLARGEEVTHLQKMEVATKISELSDAIRSLEKSQVSSFHLLYEAARGAFALYYPEVNKKLSRGGGKTSRGQRWRRRTSRNLDDFLLKVS